VARDLHTEIFSNLPPVYPQFPAVHPHLLHSNSFPVALGQYAVYASVHKRSPSPSLKCQPAG